jgi:hypothetical protein
VSTDLDRLLDAVTTIAPGLHKAGTLSAVTLKAFVRHASARPVTASAETGSGASTLLLSHISGDHTVFAMDAGTGSINAIRASPLLRQEAVTFVEGPTQLTLPGHRFTKPLQFALIDGPHGYPFPDLEYFYLYPHLETDALLVLDDIHIPTITNQFDFLRADAMFTLEEVVETTAFFRRTSAETFSPTGDGWWLQRYNFRAFESVPAESVSPAESFEAVRLDGTTPYHIDRFGSAADPAESDVVRLSASEEIVVSGWALDAARRQSASGIELIIGGKAYRTATRVPRGDVAQAYGSQGYFRSGFSTSFAPGTLPAGTHDVEVRILLDGWRGFHPAIRFRLELR